MQSGGRSRERQRQIGSSDFRPLADGFGLDARWPARVITQVGNYGEIFDRSLGPKTPLGMARGMNALWTDGGLMYAPPFR